MPRCSLRRENLLHQTFNRLTAIGFVDIVGKGKSRWLWRCGCGAYKVIRADAVKSGKSKSCDCQQLESVTKHGNAGAIKSPEYQSWVAMGARSTNPNHMHYDGYGGQGVTICERWRTFENFLADMGKKPSPEHSIDRFPNKFGNYEPDNCRWATQTEQARNKRNNVMLTLGDKTLCMAEWAETLGFRPSTIHMRLVRGWSVERTLTTPPSAYRMRGDYNP